MDLANFDLNFSFSISDVESSQTPIEDDRSTVLSQHNLIHNHSHRHRPRGMRRI